MNIIKLTNNFKNQKFSKFINWLQEDLNSVNKLILENLTNSSPS